MLKPSMQELMKRVGNRYLLVNLAAQRARDIAEEAEKSGEKLSDKAVKLALDEIAAGTVVYCPGPRTEVIIPQNNAIAAAAMVDVDDSIAFGDEEETDDIGYTDNDSDNPDVFEDEVHRLEEFDNGELDDGDVPVEDR